MVFHHRVQLCRDAAKNHRLFCCLRKACSFHIAVSTITDCRNGAAHTMLMLRRGGARSPTKNETHKKTLEIMIMAHSYSLPATYADADTTSETTN